MILDEITTYIVISRGGYELMPIPRLILNIHPLLLPIYDIMWLIILYTIYYALKLVLERLRRLVEVAVFLTPTIVRMVAVINNILVIAE